MMTRAESAKALAHRAERVHRSLLEPWPPMKERVGHGRARRRCVGEDGEQNHRDQIEDEEHGRRPSERRGKCDHQEQPDDDEAEGETVQGPLDDDGRERRPETLPAARGDVDAHEFAGAQGQEVVAHVPDHQRAEQVRRLSAGRKQIVPAPSAQPQREQIEQDTRREVTPVRVREMSEDVVEIDVPEEIDEERDADDDPSDDLDEPTARGPERGVGGRRGGGVVTHPSTSTRIMVVREATTGSLSMLASAARMSRSRASWVIITTGTASPCARPFWSTDTSEMSWRPRMPATCASTPGRSMAITRR